MLPKVVRAEEASYVCAAGVANPMMMRKVQCHKHMTSYFEINTLLINIQLKIHLQCKACILFINYKG